MIRVLVVDDHPALRAGLVSVLEQQHGIEPVGAASDRHELWPAFQRARPDLVMIDYQLPGESSLVLARKLKRVVPKPRVVFYSAYAGAALAVPVRLAGADALVSKGAPADELFEAVRRAAAGENVLPPVTPELVREVNRRLGADDRMVVSLLLDGASLADVGDALRIDAVDAETRVERLLRRVERDALEVAAAGDPATLAG